MYPFNKDEMPENLKNIKKGDIIEWYNWRDGSYGNTAIASGNVVWSTDWAEFGEWVMLVTITDDSGDMAPANGDYTMAWSNMGEQGSDFAPYMWNLGDV